MIATRQLTLGACADLVALDFHVATYDARTSLSGACHVHAPCHSHRKQEVLQETGPATKVRSP